MINIVILKLSSIIVCLLLLTVITGCQYSSSHKQHTPPTLDQQREQLASVIAATKYLKNECNHSHLPDDSVVINVVRKLIAKKGRDNLNAEELLHHSNLIYLQLQQDNTPKEVICNDFEKSLNDFISGSLTF
ncbi:TPA: type II secretion system pilot lipoprotein GspS [Escherichia coli]|nr:type II secretion system pilot lipoprotein GspS [Escherichia coli]HAW4130611.1 type II secretion system pilot lipoprotein GspS [Escherichia coli]HAW4140538.1 type II secretion system pilot lipoprotein GspS [Escherichia coli]